MSALTVTTHACLSLNDQLRVTLECIGVRLFNTLHVIVVERRKLLLSPSLTGARNSGVRIQANCRACGMAFRRLGEILTVEPDGPVSLLAVDWMRSPGSQARQPMLYRGIVDSWGIAVGTVDGPR